jgi:autotransporter-associated beta strand protein
MRVPSHRWNMYLGLIACLMLIALLSSRALYADNFDWRNINGYNWNTPIESQFGGTCWDFSACGTLEAKYKLTRNDPLFDPNVSEQHINWETNPDMGSMGGGWGPSVLSYFTSHGVVSETECPSLNTDVGTAPYWPLASGWQNRVWKSVSNLNDFTNNTNTMKSYLKTTGPLEVGIWASHDLYNTVADLKANYRAPDASGFDHEVVLVGFTDDPDVPTGGYWTIKNSWGGDDVTGYYYIPYGNIEIHNDVSAITGGVYYTGPMYHTGPWDASGVDHTGTDATITWKGTTSGTWNTSSSTNGNWSNNGNGQAFTWVNQELQAVFDNTGTNRSITLDGTVIAHGLTINSGATGYSFTGGSMTVTSGGIQANESVAINAPVSVGAPQTWTIASGKNLTINGNLHTIISALTLSGDGDTTITGSIDGGGVLNSFGAAPGAIAKTGAGTLHLTGAATYAVPLTVSGSLSFEQAGANVAYDTNTISGSGKVIKSNSGTIILSGSNNYTGATRIYGGAVQANPGTGLPNGSALILDGGVFQSNGTVNFNRNLGTGSTAFRWEAGGGGFSAGAGPMNVNVYGDGRSLNWGSTVGSQIVGTLVFGSSSAANVTTFVNPINLGSSARTVRVDDNPSSSADYAKMSGVISGAGSLIKTGDGVLLLSATPTYTGNTIISGGALQATLSSAFLSLDGGIYQSNAATTFTRTLAGSGSNCFQWTTNGGGFAAGAGPLTVRINNGNSTLAWDTQIKGILKFGSSSAVNPVDFQNGISLGGVTRTIQVVDNTLSTADYATISGDIIDGSGPAGIIKTGDGRLVLSGNSSTYTGETIVSGGTLVLKDTVNAAFLTRNFTNNAALEFNYNGVDASYSGIVSGVGSFVKSGSGTLYLTGTASSAYSGTTAVSNGTLVLAKTNGAVAASGNLLLTDVAGGGSSFLVLGGDNQVASSSFLSFQNANAWGHFDLTGHAQTLTGIDNADGRGVIEGKWDNSGLDADSVLTINSAGPNLFNGTLRDKSQGSGAGRLKLVKNGTGTLTLSGTNVGQYTGGLTVNGGTVDYGVGTLPICDYQINGGTLNIGASSQAVPSVQITSGAIAGTSGTLTSTTPFDLQSGTVSANLGGVAGLIKSTPGIVSLTKGLPGGNYVVSDGMLNISDFSQSISSFQITGGTVTGPSGTLTSATSFDLRSGTVSANLGGSAGLTKSTPGTVSLTKNLPGGNYVISDGVLNINGYSRSINAFQMNGGTITGTTATLNSSTPYDLRNGTVDVILSGNAGLIKTTPGTVSLTKSLPSGNYAISEGTLNINGLGRTIGTFLMTGGTINGTGTLLSSAAYTVRAGTIDPNLIGTVGLNKSGPGTVVLNGTNTYSGLTTVSNGTLQLGPNAQSTVLARGGADLQAGKIVFDYSGGSSPASQILSILDAGYGNGTSPFTTGQIHSSTANAAGLALGWKDDAANHLVTVMSTLYGDTDLDGLIGTSDLNAVLSHYGQQVTWSSGDFDYDSMVGSSDLGMLLANFGESLPPIIDASPYAGLDGNAFRILAGAGINVVPEPSSLILLASCLAGLLAYAWRKRK